MKVLLTGIGGFIGAHCLEYFLQNTDWQIVGIDSLRNESCINTDSKRVVIYKYDLTVPIDKAIQEQLADIDYIINLASDSAVERSLLSPIACLHNNYHLVINMLELARLLKPKVFVQVSTDEVYGESYNEAHKEWDAIMPTNPYAASKAAQEAVAIAYWRSYNIPLIIANTMNCIGERQNSEKFLPKIIWKIATGQVMEIYGEPNDIGSRHYLHCEDVADALAFLLKARCHRPAAYLDGARRPDRYNVVGDLCLDNLQVAQLVAEYMGKELKYRIVSPEARRGKKYALDGTKLAQMGWRPRLTTKIAIRRVVDWVMANPHW